MAKFNICTASDSYKFQHWNMYPKNTNKVYSYFESRTGAEYDSTVFFGLQYLLKEYLAGKVVTREKIDCAQKLINAHLCNPNAFNIDGWNYILDKFDGRLPLKIKAVQEGTPVPTGNVLMTVENIGGKPTKWLTNYVETILTHVWSPSTVATASYFAKQMMKKFLEDTSDNPEVINFMLHDFGFRGVSSFESACTAGAGHLINFMGTDTFPAVELLMDYYNESDVVAYSVPATEHSIMTARGRDGEMQILGDLLDEYPEGILSVVIDSYDYMEFIRGAAANYKDKILARNGKLVFRPDSGKPNDVTMEVLNCLAENFGYTTNSKGYKVLCPKVGALWGDGIDTQGARGILFTMMIQGFSAENIVFGMGGGLLQKVNRDTQRFAFKSSYQERDGIGYDIFKDPIDSSKASKRGQFMLVKGEDGEFKTVRQDSGVSTEGLDLLEDTLVEGRLYRDMTFSEVRRNAA